ncbi:hypothetical protein SEA_FRANSOYER_19 [Microbacterium phage Fransoyer]|nr:hypothetical protein SEA_RUBYRALPH_19 [Microbacterium phage RubyRalph]QUE25567.1 hypothetical protein SEA_SADLAD_20 [Microbacterium phage SadLad]UUG69584.1 hypothetical protein SEA_FRANSOYER_19 [Microbacterium phage Fransoyer]
MGTRADDEFRRSEERRLHDRLRPGLEEARRRVEEKRKAARRTRLHSFGLAGGRRGQ